MGIGLMSILSRWGESGGRGGGVSGLECSMCLTYDRRYHGVWSRECTRSSRVQLFKEASRLESWKLEFKLSDMVQYVINPVCQMTALMCALRYPRAVWRERRGIVEPGSWNRSGTKTYLMTGFALKTK